MTAQPTEQKTAVFTPCTDGAEATRAFPILDEDTKELPLIAERFAGRYWDGRTEDAPAKKPERRRRRGFAFAAGFTAVAAMLLLVGSLIGQAKLTAMNDELVAVSAQIAELRSKERTLRVQTEESESLAAVERYAVDTLGMHAPRLDQRNAGTAEPADRATVLNVRRGEGLRHIWESFLDTLVECF